MKARLWLGTIILLVLIVAVLWQTGQIRLFGTKDDPDSPGGKQPEDNAGPAGVGGHGSKGGPRSPNPRPKLPVTDQLENIALAQPKLIARLNLLLFDNNLNPSSADWELLGVDKDKSQALSDDLKNIFKAIKEKETKSFKVIDSSDDRVQLSIPKLPGEEAAKGLAQIESSFSQVFGRELSKLMTRSFLESHGAIAGGINNRDRVLTITPTSPEVYAATKRKYEIKTQVLFEGTQLSDALGKLDNYSQENGIELVEDIPESWSHLFDKSD